ncbi:MAG: hypothetical protein JO170_30570 [Verrucomicrobia bacterium]|nr:hypothetical protein [Verrucomicrobiota bacterium]
MNGFALSQARAIPKQMANNRKIRSHRRYQVLVPMAALILGTSALLSQAADRFPYTVSLLNVPGTAKSINSIGQIIGQASDSTGTYGYIYQNGTIQKITNLPTIPGGFPLTNNFPDAINNAGQVIGFCYDSNFLNVIGYLRNADGTMVNFYNLTGSIYCVPTGINNNGAAVGQVGSHEGEAKGFLYQNGTLTYLGTYQGSTLFAGNCINDGGQIVATYFSQRAVLITGTEIRPLGDLSRKYPDDLVSAMNNKAQIVGRSGFVNAYPAFFYFDGRIHNVGYWSPYAINNAGQVVGQTSVTPPSPAVIYTGGKLHNLDDLIDPNSGFSIYSAGAINDLGQILALCTTKSAPSTYLNCLLIPTGKSVSSEQ